MSVSSSESTGAPSTPPNIVFIVCDDLGCRDLGCFASTYYETPHAGAMRKQRHDWRKSVNANMPMPNSEQFQV